MLHDVRFAETKGSGIRVMRELMTESDLSAPLLQSDRTGNSFLVMLLFHHFLSERDLVWLKSFEDLSLSEDEMKAMISAREVGAIDNSTYRDINRGTDTLSASKHLRRLCDFALLEKKGQGPGTWYVPTPKALANWHPAGEPPELTGKSPESATKPPELTGKSPESEAKPPELTGESPESALQSVNEYSTVSSELKARIDAQGKKGKPLELAELVLAILKTQEMSLTELAHLLGRSEDHVRKTYLKPLLDAERIERSNPTGRTDPRQKYRAKVEPDGNHE